MGYLILIKIKMLNLTSHIAHPTSAYFHVNSIIGDKAADNGKY
ncbi:MAG: hypothetical protein P8017_05860 [Deltaproteobacteria bacterium]